MTTSTATATAATAPAADKAPKSDAPSVKAPTKAQAQQLAKFATAAVSAEKHAREMIAALRALRKAKVNDKTMRAWLTDALTAQGMAEKSVANRVSDALAIWRAPELPADLPASLQRAAGEVRRMDSYKAMSQKAGRRGAKAGTKTPKVQGGQEPTRPDGKVAGSNVKKLNMDVAPPSADVAPLDAAAMRKELERGLAAMRKRAADDEAKALVDALLAALAD